MSFCNNTAITFQGLNKREKVKITVSKVMNWQSESLWNLNATVVYTILPNRAISYGIHIQKEDILHQLESLPTDLLFCLK